MLARIRCWWRQRHYDACTGIVRHYHQPAKQWLQCEQRRCVLCGRRSVSPWVQVPYETTYRA
jgi:hypothetical protein